MASGYWAYGLLVAAVLLPALGALLLVFSMSGPVRAVVARLRGAEDDTVVCRCEACGKRWGAGERRLSLIGLVVRHAVRRAASRLERTTPYWAFPQGKGRCPSCLSRRARGSGEAPLPSISDRPLWPALLDAATVALGVVLLGAAALGPAGTSV